ncbi:unnamed protein product [Cochlearia groenlandica]
MEDVVDSVPVIKAEQFMCHVVGHIQSVQGSALTDPGVTTRVVVRFLIGPQVVVYLSLWDDASSVFRGLVKTANRTQSVMVVTTVNPKMFGG